jgi:hypothetical protein
VKAASVAVVHLGLTMTFLMLFGRSTLALKGFVAAHEKFPAAPCRNPAVPFDKKAEGEVAETIGTRPEPLPDHRIPTSIQGDLPCAS